MSELTTIYIDRLSGGADQSINVTLSPQFLSIEEKDLYFRDSVAVEGIAYATEEELVLRFSASTSVNVACAICNQMISLPLSVKNVYHTEPLKEIQGALFNFSDVVREALLIELPVRAECSGGTCPERATIAPYLHKKPPSGGEDVYFPFANLK